MNAGTRVSNGSFDTRLSARGGYPGRQIGFQTEGLGFSVGGASMLGQGAVAELFENLKAPASVQKRLALAIGGGDARPTLAFEFLAADNGIAPERRERAQISPGEGHLTRELLLDGYGFGGKTCEPVLGFGYSCQTEAKLFFFCPAEALLPPENPLQTELKPLHRTQSLAAIARSRSQVSGNVDFSEVCWRRNVMISGWVWMAASSLGFLPGT